MKAQPGIRDDGLIGLGVLVLMAMALISGQFHDSVASAASSSTRSESSLFGDQRQAPTGPLDGAIREFKIVPSLLDSAADLGWSSDEDLINASAATVFDR